MTSDNDLRRAAHINARSCTCHPDDAPVPCQRGYALSVCKARAALRKKVAQIFREGGVIYGIPEDMADAAITVVLEEAARVASDDGHSHGCNCEYCYGHEHAAAAIRGLIKEKSDG
jgi:hypothetical protein